MGGGDTHPLIGVACHRCATPMTFPMTSITTLSALSILQYLGQLIQWFSNGIVSGRRIYCLYVHRPAGPRTDGLECAYGF